MDTLRLEDAEKRIWDCIIIGAGPAGASLANRISDCGSILVIDREKFPRFKVCGGCLNKNSVRLAEELDPYIFNKIDSSVSLTEFRCQINNHQICLPIHGGYAVNRAEFDALIMQSAINKAVHFLSGHNAKIGLSDDNHREILLEGRSIQAKLVVIASGLNLPAFKDLSESIISRQIIKSPSLGFGTLCQLQGLDISIGTIYMLVQKDGYLGITRLKNGSYDLAASIQKNAVKQSGPAEWILDCLTEHGFPALPSEIRWKGTSYLSREADCLGRKRLLVIGDSASYIEPFTGEGISWALLAAKMAVRHVHKALKSWDESVITEWEKDYKLHITKSQRTCRMLQKIIRSESASCLLGITSSRIPFLLKPFINLVHHGVA